MTTATKRMTTQEQGAQDVRRAVELGRDINSMVAAVMPALTPKAQLAADRQRFELRLRDMAQELLDALDEVIDHLDNDLAVKPNSAVHRSIEKVYRRATQ